VKQPRETIRAFSNEMQAHLARSMLKRAGIAATVQRHSRYKAMTGGGYRLKTAPRDVEEARRILSTLDEAVDMDEYVDADDRSYRRCPACNSVNVWADPLPKRLVVWVVLTAGLLLLFLKRDWSCVKCGHTWHG